MIRHAKYFPKNNKTMSFKVMDKKLLKKYTKIWDKNISLMNKELDSEPVYGDNDKYIKTNIKSHGDKINTNFQGRKVPKRKYINDHLIHDDLDPSSSDKESDNESNNEPDNDDSND